MIIVSQSPNHVIDLNGNVEFRCTASSSPVSVIKVQWIRNNNVMSENNVLALTKVSITDEGNYTCHVIYEDNRAKDKTLRLNVKCKFVLKLLHNKMLTINMPLICYYLDVLKYWDTKKH